MKKYRVGASKDKNDIWVNDISEFWAKAKIESRYGAKFHISSYDMMCYDSLPAELREFLRNAKENISTSEVLKVMKYLSADMTVEFLKDQLKNEPKNNE